MDFGTLFANLFLDYTVRTIALGTAVLGVVSGALGSFALLRRQSLLGDALSHAALPGVALAFLFTGSKTPITLMLGAAAAGVLAILAILGITRATRLKEDTALALVLSTFFGFGLMLLTYLQRNPDARQAGLTSFLFGQAATLLERDVSMMAIFGGLALLVLALFWKEFKLLSFDRDFGDSVGLPMHRLDILLTSLLVVAVVIGLQAVGVVLMSAMLVAPGAAARQWTDRLDRMVVLAGVFGALAGVAGALASSMGRGLSTGPIIVLAASVIALVSLLFAPNRGVLAAWLRRRRNQRRLLANQVLADLYRLGQQHANPQTAHSRAALRVMAFGAAGVSNTLTALEKRGLVQALAEDHWALTAAGTQAAEAHLEDVAAEEDR